MREIVRKVPIPAGGVALGLAALGNLLQPYSPGVHTLCGALALFMAALVAAKAIMFPRMIAEDLKNPLLASVSATFWMACMQLSTYAAPINYHAALGAWVLSVAAHLALMGWFTARLVRSFDLSQVFPTYFICYVGIIVASVTSPVFGMEAAGRALFWVGFACYPVMLALVTLRYIKHPVPDAARPLFCIYSAPASLSLAGYLAVTPEPSIAFVAVLLMAGQAFFVLALFCVPRFVALGFFPSFAAMTFPFVITATALGCALEMLAASGVHIFPIFDVLVLAETSFAIAMVGFVLMKYLSFLFVPAVPEPAAEAAGEIEVEGEAA